MSFPSVAFPACFQDGAGGFLYLYDCFIWSMWVVLRCMMGGWMDRWCEQDVRAFASGLMSVLITIL
jgi:hypothetical protein